MNNQIADKLKKQEKEALEQNVVGMETLGLSSPFPHSQGIRQELQKKQEGLVAVFGRAAFDKAIVQLRVRQAGSALAAALRDPSREVGNYGIVRHGEYKYSLKQLFPSLNPKERVEVKAELEKKGFTTDGEKLTGFKFNWDR